jgi:phage terminase large subunit-like protein
MDILLAEDQWRDIPDLLDYLEMLQMTVFRGAPILLEEVSAFKALSQVARRLNNRLQIYPITPKGNKFLRAQPTADAWNQGRIRTPFEAPWVADFHREVKRFTGKQGGKDNRVDAMTQLEDYLEKLFAGLATAQSGGETAMGSSPF